jgi:hypothetical protein
MAVVFGAFHLRAARFALSAAADCKVERFSLEEHEAHLVASRGDSNRDLISIVGFAGLMLFSTLECITGLAKIDAEKFDIAPADVQAYGPAIYNFVLLVTCVSCLAVYLRLAAAVADFSIQLDPTDRPYQAFKLTDTLLGYLLLVFFYGVAVHLAAFAYGTRDSRLWVVDAVAIATALAAYPARIKWAAYKEACRRAGPKA